jgi:hypothetical protein
MIIPVVSTVYTATTADTFAMTRTCSQCRKASPANVSVYSVGEAETLIPLHDRSDTAREVAFAGLRPAAEHTLALAACPHCRHREQAQVRKVRFGAITAAALTAAAVVPFVLAAMTLLIAAMVIVMEHLYLDGALTVLVGLAFVTVGWLVARHGARKRMAHQLEMADAQVMWLGFEQTAPVPAHVPAPAPRNETGWPFA